MDFNAEYWVSKLGLIKHPEGGYFKETYRSDEVLSVKSLPNRYNSFRPYSTSIYFLLESKTFSAFHKIKSDEIWHFHAGSAVTIYLINSSGNLIELKLGNNPEKGENLQIVIPRNHWFAAEVKEPNTYSLMACTVSPGFDFQDFELGKQALLSIKYPKLKDLIQRFTRI
jgi:hypothetical protein